MRFEFATATRIIFGAGTVHSAGEVARDFGRKALVVTGGDATRAEPLLDSLRHAGIETCVFQAVGEPSLETIREGVARGSQRNCELVIAFGGGSVLDSGKAIAAMLTNPGDVLDYVEIIGKGKTLALPSVRFIAIPTTAGTGSEVTRNAVLASPEHGVKVSLRSPFLLPSIAWVDPELTYTLPPSITATTGLDALTQLIEPYVCCRANPMTDALCLEGLGRAARSLLRVFRDGRDAYAREDMCVASLCGGLALANAGLGAVHGFAAVIGGTFDAPHGALCAALLPDVMEENLAALRQRQPNDPALSRYETVGRLLTGNASASADEGVGWVRRLVKELQIAPLRDYGLESVDFPEVIEKSSKASSMKANPIVLLPGELEAILRRAL